jgi:hypothetical protein
MKLTLTPPKRDPGVLKSSIRDRIIQKVSSLIALAPAALALVVSPSLQAAPHASPRAVSALLGWSSVSDNVGSGIAFGVAGSYFFRADWGMGAFLRAGNHSNDINSFFWGFEGLYRPVELVSGFTVGASLGSGKFTAQNLSGDSRSALASIYLRPGVNPDRQLLPRSPLC